MPTLTRDGADRLAKLLGLLGSAHDGEVLAAARMAHRFVCQQGFTWGEVIAPAALPPPPPPRRRRQSPPPPPPPPRDVLADWPTHWKAARTLCLSRLDHTALNDWERMFLRSIRDWQRPTTRQLDCLLNIAIKVS